MLRWLGTPNARHSGVCFARVGKWTRGVRELTRLLIHCGRVLRRRTKPSRQFQLCIVLTSVLGFGEAIWARKLFAVANSRAEMKADRQLFSFLNTRRIRSTIGSGNCTATSFPLQFEACWPRIKRNSNRRLHFSDKQTFRCC